MDDVNKGIAVRVHAVPLAPLKSVPNNVRNMSFSWVLTGSGTLPSAPNK